MTTIAQSCSLETTAHDHPYAADGYLMFFNPDGTFDAWHRHQPPPSPSQQDAIPCAVTPHLTEAEARVATVCIGCDQLKDPACWLCWRCFALWGPTPPKHRKHSKRSFETRHSELTPEAP